MAEEERRLPGTSEEDPLLGGPGDASQQDGKPLYHNFFLGESDCSQERASMVADAIRRTGTVAQAGAWILAAIVWGSVFSHDLILFSAHPLLNSAALLFLIQAILILQPTHTRKQKKQGTFTHAALNDVAVLSAVAGLVIIEYNKIKDGNPHFESVHGILGLITYILIILQALVGITQYFTPALYGGEENAKALYKYHRVGGYVTLVVMLATVCAATQTGFGGGVLGMQLWAVVAGSVVVVVGVVPRVRLSKFGWLGGQ